MALLEVEIRRNTNRSAEGQSGSTDSSPVLKVSKIDTPGTSARRRSLKSLDSSTPSKKEPGTVIAPYEAPGGNQGGLGVDVKWRVDEIERKGAINGQSTVSLLSTETEKWKGKCKMQAEDSDGRSTTLHENWQKLIALFSDSSTKSDRHDTVEANIDSLITRTDKIQELLDKINQRETEYWEEVERKEDQMTDVDARKTKTRKDMLNDSLTEENKRELAAKYKHLQEVQELAEREIKDLQERLAKTQIMIKDLRKELAEVRKALEEKENEGHILQRSVNVLEKQVKTLKEELDVTKAKLKRYEEKYPELEESDISTPTSSQVSFETPKDSPVIQDSGAAESSSPQVFQRPAAQTEPVDREGSPDGTIQDPDGGTPLEKVSSGSSGTRSSRKPRGKVLRRDSRTSKYPGVLPRTTVIREITETVHEMEKHKTRKDHHQKCGHGRKSSKGSN